MGGAAIGRSGTSPEGNFRGGEYPSGDTKREIHCSPMEGGGLPGLGKRTKVLQTWQIEKRFCGDSNGFRTANCEEGYSACRNSMFPATGRRRNRRLKRRCRFPGHAVSAVKKRMWPPTDNFDAFDPDAAVAGPGSAGNDPGSAGAVLNRRGDMNIDLEEIRAVFFRCNECRTAVSFPRIRWANLPENCPNCGAAWMKEPTSELAVPEDSTTRAFKAVRAFRDALQALISASRTIAFTIGFETGESSEAGEDTAKQAGAGSSTS